MGGPQIGTKAKTCEKNEYILRSSQLIQVVACFTNNKIFVTSEVMWVPGSFNTELCCMRKVQKKRVFNQKSSKQFHLHSLTPVIKNVFIKLKWWLKSLRMQIISG